MVSRVSPLRIGQISLLERGEIRFWTRARSRDYARSNFTRLGGEKKKKKARATRRAFNYTDRTPVGSRLNFDSRAQWILIVFRALPNSLKSTRRTHGFPARGRVGAPALWASIYRRSTFAPGNNVFWEITVVSGASGWNCERSKLVCSIRPTLEKSGRFLAGKNCKFMQKKT